MLTPERLVQLSRVTRLALSPCGKWAAVQVQRLNNDKSKFVSDLWRVEIDGDRAPLQLTRGEFNDSAPQFRSDGSLGFLSNRPLGKGGDEDNRRTQVWLLPEGGGEPRSLTDEPLGVSTFRFASRADVLAVLANMLPEIPIERQRESAADRAKNGPSALHYKAMPVRSWDHWIEPAAPHVVIFDGDGGVRRDLTPQVVDETQKTELAVSPDGRKVAVLWARMGRLRLFERWIRLFDAATGPLPVSASARFTHSRSDVSTMSRSRATCA